MRNSVLVALAMPILAMPCHGEAEAIVAVIPFQAVGVSPADAHGLTVLFKTALHKGEDR